VAEARARATAQRVEVRQQLAGLRIRQVVLRHLGRYLQAQAGAGRGSGGEAALLKLAMAQLVQETAAVAVGIAGVSAIAWEQDSPHGAQWCAQLCNARSASIGGGTNEILKSVVAERVLGLPRDIEVDLDIPFRSLLVGTQR